MFCYIFIQSYDAIAQHETDNKEGQWITTDYGDCFGIDTGEYTGRSPKDKYLVKRDGTESGKNIWWGEINQPVSEKVFNELKEKCVDHYNKAPTAYGK